MVMAWNKDKRFSSDGQPYHKKKIHHHQVFIVSFKFVQGGLLFLLFEYCKLLDNNATETRSTVTEKALKFQ